MKIYWWTDKYNQRRRESVLSADATNLYIESMTGWVKFVERWSQRNLRRSKNRWELTIPDLFPEISTFNCNIDGVRRQPERSSLDDGKYPSVATWLRRPGYIGGIVHEMCDRTYHWVDAVLSGKVYHAKFSSSLERCAAVGATRDPAGNHRHIPTFWRENCAFRYLGTRRYGMSTTVGTKQRLNVTEDFWKRDMLRE